jgi:hypothetical protein
MTRDENVPRGLEASGRVSIEQILEFLRMHLGAIRSVSRRPGACRSRLGPFPGKRYARNSRVATSAKQRPLVATIILADAARSIAPIRARS